MSKLIGIDIRGRHVRAVLLRTAYRRVVLESFAEIDRLQLPGLDEAVQACLLPLVPQSDAIAVGIDGDQAFVHRLSLPPTALKQLAEVVPFELEAQVPLEFDQLVHDYVTLPRTGPGSPIAVLAAAVRTEHVKERIDLLSRTIGRDAERVGVGALPLANLAMAIPVLDSNSASVVLELGDERSELVAMHRGFPGFARTLSIGVSGLPQSAPQLAAQLRQTMAAATLAIGVPIEAIFLTGGGASAGGAEAYLSAELGLPVTPLPIPELDGLTPDQIDALPRFARALGLALGLRGRARDPDLRRGALSYQRGYAFLKEKAPLLAALGGTVLLSFLLSTWAELRSIGHEHEQLSKTLAAMSKDALGEEATDPDKAKELLDDAAAKAETDPMPHFDAFDLMVELSKAVPATIVHDVDELEFSRDHAKIRGIVGSAAEAQEIADALKENHCFSDPKINKVSQVVNGTRQKYMLEVDIKCPEDTTTTKKKADSEEAKEQ
jgi:general secretion pathway protein L